MPVSNDNQDYNNPENKKNKEQSSQSEKAAKKSGEGPEAENNMTSDNLKGKKVDADPEKETDKPADI